jgi:energy-coupling factor transporter transmembrane protein EcfT
VGVSLVRSVERTERIQQAMHCRGFQGRLRTLHRFEAGVGDGVKCIGCLACAGFLWWLDGSG